MKINVIFYQLMILMGCEKLREREEKRICKSLPNRSGGLGLELIVSRAIIGFDSLLDYFHLPTGKVYNEAYNHT